MCTRYDIVSLHARLLPTLRPLTWRTTNAASKSRGPHPVGTTSARVRTRLSRHEGKNEKPPIAGTTGASPFRPSKIKKYRTLLTSRFSTKKGGSFRGIKPSTMRHTIHHTPCIHLRYLIATCTVSGTSPDTTDSYEMSVRLIGHSSGGEWGVWSRWLQQVSAVPGTGYVSAIGAYN